MMILEIQFELEDEMKKLKITNPVEKIKWLNEQRTIKLSSYKNRAINSLISLIEIEEIEEIESKIIKKGNDLK